MINRGEVVKINLRQKVKKAKKELRHVQENYPDTYPYEMVVRFQKEEELKEIINYKRNFNRYYNWNEDYNIDMDNLTYIDFCANGEVLTTLTTSNGKILSKNQINWFINKEAMFYLLQHGRKIKEKQTSTYKINKDELLHGTEYYWLVSNDKTKGKRLHKIKFAFQPNGTEEIRLYQNNEKEGD